MKEKSNLNQILNNNEEIDLTLSTIGIYKIINPKNKIYIGQTTNYIKRLKQYNNLNCKSQTKLYNSFKKYGVENHIFNFIEITKEIELNERERYWQDFYNVLDKKLGLNLRLQTSKDISGNLSEETKLKISLSLKGKTGRKHSEETKQKISLLKINKKMSLKYLEKIKGKRLLGNNNNSKKVICTKTGKIWDSITECAIENNLKSTILMWNLRNPLKNKTTFKHLENE